MSLFLRRTTLEEALPRMGYLSRLIRVVVALYMRVLELPTSLRPRTTLVLFGHPCLAIRVET